MLQGLAVAARPPVAGDGPDRLSPLSLADDSPWGNILVHEPNAAEALDLQRILRMAGYRIVGPAVSLADVERLLARNTLDCAVLDAAADDRAAFAIGTRLDEAGIPFVVLAQHPAGALAWRRHGQPVVLRPYRAGEILRAIHAAMRTRGRGQDRPKRIATRAS